MHARLTILILVALAGTAFGQSMTTGAVEGRVTDKATKEPLVGVTVIATGASPEPQSALTDGDGIYKITDLLPGNYSVTFYVDQLVVTRKNIRVSANDQVTVNQALALTGAATVYEIHDTPVQINQSTTTKGGKYGRPFLEKVPLPNRGIEGAAGTTAGANNDGLGIAFSGSTSLENRYLVDGIDITGLTYGSLGTPILSEFIEETEVIAGGYNAEWGRAIGGIINAVTKTGSNEFRGSVFATLAPSFLARRGQATPVNASSIDVTAERAYAADFGFDLGGPIIKDRLFFYVGFAPQLTRTDYTRTTKRQTDCRARLDNGQLSACDARLASAGGHADGSADIDPNTGFYITDELDSEVRSGTSQQYSAIGKLNLAVTPSDQAQFSVIAVPNKGETPGLYGLPTSGGRASGLTTDTALRWSSKLDDGKTEIEALVAWHRSTNNTGSIDPTLDDQPRQILQDGNLGVWSSLGGETAKTAQGCTDSQPGGSDPYPFLAENCPMSSPSSYAIGGPGAIQHDKEERRMGRIGITQRGHLFGNHELKAGLDFEQDLKTASRIYSGGAFIQNSVGSQVQVTRWVQLAPIDNKDPRFDQKCRTDDPSSQSAVGGTLEFACDHIAGTAGSPGTLIGGETVNWSAYLRDSWRVRRNLTLNAGARYEEQRLRYAANLRGTVDPLTGNRYGKDAMNLKGNIAPRFGVIWDPTEEGRSKVFASWGRFFESIPMDINDRSFGGEVSYVQTFATGAGSRCGGIDPQIGGVNGLGCLTPTGSPNLEQLLGSSGVLVAPGIKAQYMDEILIGAEYQLEKDFKIGITYQNRTLGRVIEDVSTDGANTYIIANPGEFSMAEQKKLEEKIARTDDPKVAARLQEQLDLYKGIRIFDRPQRTYDALEISAAHQFSRGLMVQASYTHSRTKGNYPGSISYDNGQVDPNISSQYDLIELLSNRNGALPQDRPHSLKLDGFYTFDLGKVQNLTIGTRARVVSGIPKNALGAHYLYGADESFLLPRGVLGRSEVEHAVDLHLAYARKLGKGVTAEVFVDIFNLYNRQATFDTDQTYAPQFRAGGGGENNVNPIVGGAYEDLLWAKAIDNAGVESGTPTARNPNFGRTTSRYAPSSARLGFRLTF
jgi:outer membrane receptor protein involved in Fe transport